MIITIVILTVIIVYQGIIGYMNKRELILLVKDSHDLLQEGMDKWQTERQQLLDRIQESNYTKIGYENLESVVSKERDTMLVERREWAIERQALLDRIQAPTFAEYKHQEAKVIKAKNGTDKPDIVIEQL